jgi:hypothetical protein
MSAQGLKPLNQIWLEWSFGGPFQNCVPTALSSIQDGSRYKKRKETKPRLAFCNNGKAKFLLNTP